MVALCWLAAPASQAQHRPEIHCKHFIFGYPYGTPITNDLIIRDIYALSNNDETKFADWVAYRLDTATMKGPTRSRNWKADPWLEDHETLKPAHYKDAPELLKIDRGHQAPLANFSGSRDWAETNYLSNITPQRADLNQGAWVKLENIERKIATLTNELYVMTGPLYERSMQAMPNAPSHQVPSGYWKILAIRKGSGLEVMAFIMDQDTPRNARVIDFLASVDDVERRTGLDFFWLMEDTAEEAMERVKNTKWAEEMLR
jgi:endonuclease G, mitochondrial